MKKQAEVATVAAMIVATAAITAKRPFLLSFFNVDPPPS
jgi:hypothetical protein